ncbi:MAG: hypothetical protein LBS26_01945 [Campylobacteraceae bacterium]|jgi:hypothetical protein|nr:hypothetical protein [Campylobacteraceae bacterium]
MKVSILIKILISVMLCSFLFIGCGSGTGESGSDTNGTGGTGGTGGGDDGGEAETTALLDYYSIENNMSDPVNGLLYIRNRPEITNKIIDSGISLKHITYHNVASSLARNLFVYLTEEAWVDTPCKSIWYDTEIPFYCAAFVANGALGGVSLQPNVYSAIVAFNSNDIINCGGETCDVTLTLRVNPNYYKIRELDTIPINEFKYAFTSGIDGTTRGDILKSIENSAQSVSIQIARIFSLPDTDPLYLQVQYNIEAYIDQLGMNQPAAFYRTKEDIDGSATGLVHKGAIYTVKTAYENGGLYSWFSISGSKINLNW